MKTLWKRRGKRQNGKEQEQGFWKGNHHRKSLDIAGKLGNGGYYSTMGVYCMMGREGSSPSGFLLILPLMMFICVLDESFMGYA